MKRTNLIKSILAVGVALFYAAGAFADDEDKHDHDHDHDHDHIIAGPNGGRVLVGVEPHLEFFVTKDGKVQITAVNNDGQTATLREGYTYLAAQPGDRAPQVLGVTPNAGRESGGEEIVISARGTILDDAARREGRKPAFITLSPSSSLEIVGGVFRIARTSTVSATSYSPSCARRRIR